MMNLADALAHHVRARPDRAAIIQGERVVAYRDLDGIVRRGAAHLAALGIGEGDVVGIALRDSTRRPRWQPPPRDGAAASP